jgi:hypothetical protein
MAKVSKVKMTVEIEYDVTDPKAAPGSTIRIPGQIRNIITERIGTSPTHIDPDSVKVIVTKKTIDGRMA